MDVEDVRTTFYDTLRIAWKMKIQSNDAVLQTQVESDMIYEYGKNVWRLIPGKIKFGNGISWVCIISLNLERNRGGEYILEKMTVQHGILDLLQYLPVSWRGPDGGKEFWSFRVGGRDLVGRGPGLRLNLNLERRRGRE